MKRLWVVMLLLFALSGLLIAARPFQATPPDWTNLVGVLGWVAAGGAFLFVGKGLTFLLEKVPGWGTAVPSGLRPWIVLIIGIGGAFGAQYLLTQVTVITALSPWFERLIVLALLWYGSQSQFEALKAAGRITRPAPVV